MAHFNPFQPLRIPCEGRGCAYFRTDDDGQTYCTFAQEIYGHVTLTSQVVSCPKCM